MDDAQKVPFSSLMMSLILLVGMLAGFHGEAIDMEYIDPSEAKRLEQEFAQSSLNEAQKNQIREKSWTCDMYGVRSRLQVQRGIKLYDFDKKEWRNKGAQVVRHYASNHEGLSGANEKFEDQIKMNSNGELISRLSLTQGDRGVLAYSVCKTL